MTQYMNRVAVESWVGAGEQIKMRLQKTFSENGLGEGAVQTWANQIIRNAFEESSEIDSAKLTDYSR